MKDRRLALNTMIVIVAFAGDKALAVAGGVLEAAGVLLGGFRPAVTT